MPIVRLTARNIGTLKPLPGQRRSEYFDENLPGFHVRVTEAGAKSYGLLYRHARRRCRLTLGSTDKLSLADARKMAREALREIANGVDPAAKKKKAREADSFADLADQYLERWAKRNKKSWREDERLINNKLLPAFGKLPAKEIRRADVRTFLESIVQRPAPIEANRTLAVIRKIYNWGISQDLVENNPCHGLPRPGKEKQRDRVLTDDEIQKVWKALDKEPVLTAGIFKLLLLTAQRKTEVLSMRKEDIDGSWWTIPPDRSKNNLPHRVPLSKLAIRILDELRENSSESSWIFPSRIGDGHIAHIHKIVDRVRERCDVEFRTHDLRRTAASKLTSMGISRLTVSKILNHVEQGVTRVYDRHSYDREKKEALEAWGRHLETLVGGGEGWHHSPVSPEFQS